MVALDASEGDGRNRTIKIATALVGVGVLVLLALGVTQQAAEIGAALDKLRALN